MYTDNIYITRAKTFVWALSWVWLIVYALRCTTLIHESEDRACVNDIIIKQGIADLSTCRLRVQHLENNMPKKSLDVTLMTFDLTSITTKNVNLDIK